VKGGNRKVCSFLGKKGERKNLVSVPGEISEEKEKEWER